MSFILDALKKSESERQRQAGPALFEVKVTPPRHRVGPWAAALAALLAINLGVVGWMLARDRSPHPGAGAQEQARMAATAAPAPASVSAEAARRQAVTPVSSTAQDSASVTVAAPGAPEGAQSAPATVVQSGPPIEPSDATARTASSGSQANPSALGSADSNPADFAPAVEPPRSLPAASDGGSVTEEAGSLPTYQEAAAAPGADIPPLRLDLHVYSAQPDQRFVFLNMVKLHEGDSLPQGVRVDQITPDGVILSYQGQKFVLHRQ